MSNTLSTFFNPESIVLVGASERSAWSNTANQNLIDLNYSGKIYYVNRKGNPVYGSKAYTRVSEIGQPVDLALLMLPAHAVEEGLADLNQAGVRCAVLLASGFAETGDEGKQAQDRVVQLAKEYGISILGPNCVGFVNYAKNAAAFTIKPPMPVLRGTLGVISQSGAVGTLANQFAHRQNIGLSCLITTGNEAAMDTGQLIDYLVDDPSTSAIAVFLETVRDTKTFSVAAKRALAAGKPIVALKIGTNPITAQTAQAHTGALVGDDSVFSAVCRQLGIVRASSIEELVITAEIMSRTGVIRGGGLGLASISGGICEIMGDAAGEVGLDLPVLHSTTQARLKEILPDFGTAHNPLDVTGAFILDPKLTGQTVKIVAEDPGLGVLGVAFDVPVSEQQERAYSRPSLEAMQQAAAEMSIPCLIISHTSQSLTEHALKTVNELGLNYLPCGVDVAIPAIAHAFKWSAAYLKAQETSAQESSTVVPTHERPGTEYALLKVLDDKHVPVIPQRLVASAQDAAAAAAEVGFPVVMKIASPDIAHKTEVGGVVLNLKDETAVLSAFQAMMSRVEAAAPDAKLDGALISPMRSGGLELLVGIHHDPQWGPVLAVGMGGVWVEILKDTSLRTLPVSEQDVLDMFTELRSAALLEGYRGQPGADRRALAKAIVAIANAALSFGSDLATLEVNPLLVSGDQVEALDALAIWKDGVACSKGVEHAPA